MTVSLLLRLLVLRRRREETPFVLLSRKPSLIKVHDGVYQPSMWFGNVFDIQMLWIVDVKY